MPPPRRAPDDLSGYLEALCRPVFQAGMNWRVVDAEWDGIRQAFAGFEPRAVAEFGQDDGAYHFLYAVDEPVPARDEHGDADGSAQRQADSHHRTAERVAVACLDGAAVGGDHGAHDRQSKTCSR